MKPNPFNRLAALQFSGLILATSSLSAQTVEINPASAIPSAYSLVQSWDWDTPGNLESWTANANLTLEAGTPTIDGAGPSASVKGTSAGNDPNFTSPLTTIATPYRVVIEFRIRKESSDNSRIDLFWDDAAGGFAGARVATVSGATFAPDDSFKIVRFTFPYGRIATQLDRLRLDPIADAGGVGKTTAIDYLRVYTETRPTLAWDADTVTAGAQGGSGVWDENTSSLWWNGAANTTWPVVDTFAAIFGGTAGTVTVAGTGVNASVAEFTTGGYTVAGGPIQLGGESAYLSTPASATTRIDSPLTGTAALTLRSGASGAFVIGGSSPSFSASVTSATTFLGFTGNTPLGTGTITFGAAGNVWLSALDGNRTLANNVIFAGNRTVINNADLGTGLTVGGLTLDGDVALNSVSPADLYLKSSLTINGNVSGSNSGIGLLLAGDPNTLTLTGENTFTGNVKWTNNSVIAVDADSALGDSANTLNFNAGAGSLTALASFDSARAININGSTTGTINTDSHDVELSGNITGVATDPNQTKLAKTGTGTLILSGAASTIQGGIRVLAGTVEIPSGSLTYSRWDGSYGVAGNASLIINGGSLTTNGSYLAIGNGTNPGDNAQMTVSSGTFTQGLELLTAQNGNGTFTITGGLANLNQLSFGDGPDASRTATINLNGGTVSLNRTNRRAGSASATINFNGSTLIAESDQTDFLRGTPTDTQYNVQAGGAIIDTLAFNLEILVPLQAGSPSGGLTKRGSGSLTLDATNTYTGDTVVEAGTLVLTGGSIADSAKLVIDPGAVVDLAADETVNSLFYGASQQAAGTYGRSDVIPAVDFPDDTRFSGPGTLTVTSGSAATGYTAWAAANAGGEAADLDTDKDGVPNGVEYFMGQTGSSFTNNPVISGSTITWPKDPGYAGTFKVQLSDTLAAGSWTDITPPDPSIDTTNPNQVVFTIPTGAPKKFIRLSVTPAP